MVTADPRLAETLRHDDRLVVLAHLEDVALVGAVATSLPVDLILVDERLASAVELALAGHQIRAEVCRVPSTPRHPRYDGPPPGREAVDRPVSEPVRPLTLRDWSTLWDDPGEERPLRGRQGRVARPATVTEVLMRQVIVVTSPKGGVGKTFVSVNLAAGLARHTGFRVLLVDLDLDSADVAVHLDLVGRPTLAELLPYAGALEPAHLERAVTSHRPSRLDVILAPARPEAAETVTREHLAALFRLSRQVYDFVVVDTSPDPSDPALAAGLAEATAVVLVSTLDAAALRQCRLCLEGWVANGPGSDGVSRLTLVVNQSHTTGPITADRAGAFLGAAAAEPLRIVHIPENRGRVEQAIYEGRPLVLAEPGHPVARALFELAHGFCPVFSDVLGVPHTQRGGWRGLVEALRRW